MYSEQNYWNNEYSLSHGSGLGSTGAMLDHKIEFLNKFFKDHNIKTVIDFGCGDGKLMKNLKIEDEDYIGIDISEVAVEICERIRPKAQFIDIAFPEFEPKFKADCCICIDVLFHIIDDIELELTLKKIFEYATRFVILYTFNQERENERPHVKSRIITQIVERLKLKYKVLEKIPGHEQTEALWLVYKK